MKAKIEKVFQSDEKVYAQVQVYSDTGEAMSGQDFDITDMTKEQLTVAIKAQFNPVKLAETKLIKLKSLEQTEITL